MEVDVLRPQELTPALAADWQAFQQADERLENPFLSPAFTRAVGGVRDAARVAVVRDGDGTAAFLPFERARFGAGLPIGAGLSDCQALVHRPGWTCDPGELLARCRLTVWRFDHLVPDGLFAAHHHRLHDSPVIDLSRGFAAYLEERRQASRTLVTSTQRKARRLEREVGPLRFDADGTDRAALRRLLAWKSDQYARTGAPDLFGDPGVVRLLEALVDRPSPGCTATVAALYAGDRLVAAHLGLRSPSVLAYWFPAYDPALQAYSPGRVLLLRLAEAAAGRGIATLDLGRGHEQYKQRFASRALQVAEGAVHLPGLVGAAQRAAGLPRRLGLRYVADGPLEPAARRVIDAVRRARQARRPGATAPAGRR